MKPLDFVVSTLGSVGMIKEVNSTNEPIASVAWIYNPGEYERTAWWDEWELKVVGSLPNLLSQNLKHPFGVDSYQPYD